jgi:hypothetical protein
MLGWRAKRLKPFSLTGALTTRLKPGADESTSCIAKF